MADQRVNINIGSSYNGAGMSKALGAVNTMSGQAKKAAGAVGQLAGAFEGLGGTASKSIGAVSGALGALATGGIFGAIIFAVTALVGWFAKLGEQEKPIEKMKKTLEGVGEATEKIVTSTNNAITKIDKTTKAVDALTAAHLRLANAEAKAQKNALDETIENLTSDGTDEGAARNIMTKAAAEKAKVQIDAKTAEKAADAIVEGIGRKISAQNEKIGTLRNAIHGYEDSGVRIEGLDDKKSTLESEVAEAKRLLYVRRERKADDDEIKEAEDQLKEAVKALNDFINKTYNPTVRQLNDAQQELKIQEANLKAAEAERTNVLSDNSKKLKAAEDVYIGATWEAAHARERSKIEEEQLVAEQLARAANMQALDERQTELQIATRHLAEAERSYANRLKESADAQAALAAIQAGGVWNPNGAMPGRDRGSGPASNNSDWGNWGTFGKPKGWDARYWQTHPDEAAAAGVQAGLSPNEQRDFDAKTRKLQNAGAMTPEDREKVLGKKGAKEWEEAYERTPEYQAELAKIRAQKAEKQRDDLKTKIENLNTSVKNIETWLNNHDGAQ